MAHPCPRCGGELDRAIGATYSRCAYCSAAVVYAGDEPLERYVVPKRLTPETARRALDRWMAGNEPSRWLSLGAKLDAPELVWLPVWYARTKVGEKLVANEHRADGACVPEVKRRLVPGSGLRRLDDKREDDAALPPPTIDWSVFAKDKLHEADVVEKSLVHVPFYRFLYRYRGRRYSASVDAATGEVRPGRYPKRPTMPFIALTIGTIATFAIADIWYGYARMNGDTPPHIVPLIYPFAWIALFVIARLLTAVF